MKIDVYSNMYNEERLLPYWLRYYEPIANRIFVWEDESTDKTREILLSRPKVKVLEMEQHGDNDEYWVRNIFPLYEKYSLDGKADWIIFADTDEFIYHPRLLEILEEEDKKGTQVIHCTGYTMISETFPTTKGQIMDEIKLGLPDMLESKWTVFKAIPGIRWGHGRHGPIYNHSAFARNRNTGIKLLHYRYLGREYYSNRDRVTLERNDLAFHHGKKYDENFTNTCPDGTKYPALAWYDLHKGDAKNVVDEGW